MLLLKTELMKKGSLGCEGVLCGTTKEHIEHYMFFRLHRMHNTYGELGLLEPWDFM